MYINMDMLRRMPERCNSPPVRGGVRSSEPLTRPVGAGAALVYRGAVRTREAWRFRLLGGGSLLIPAWLAAACAPATVPGLYQGYLEAEYVYVASPQGGALHSLRVQRGQDVPSGAPLFDLDPEPEATLARQAADNLDRALARLRDLQKGQRPSEVASIEARRDQARANLALAEVEYRRAEDLHRDEVVPIDDVDRARAAREQYEAQVAQYTADLETARLGARSDVIEEAEAAAAAARAELARAEWVAAQKSQAAPAAGRVHDTLYRPGEWVAPGVPVVVLLPPENLKVRFFVPQGELSRVPPGAAVRVTFDGGARPYEASVSYVSTQAEFTPPVIYSQQTRDKLVFMVEAKLAPSDFGSLRPGQPVDVTLER